MKRGTITRDIECCEPYAKGTLKAGTAVQRVRKGTWEAWTVTNHDDVPFMSSHDWKYRYLTVPDDAVEVRA